MMDWENDIKRYLQGEMTPEEMHALEKKALHDPFLADALEGASHISPEDFSNDLADLQKSIHLKTKAKPWLWPLRIAASLVLLVASYLMFTTLFEKDIDQNLALQNEQTPLQNNEPAKQIDEQAEQNKVAKQPAPDQHEKSGSSAKRNNTDPTKVEAIQPEVRSLSNQPPSENTLSKEEIAKAVTESENVVSADQELIESKTEALRAPSAEKKAMMQSKTFESNQHIVQGKVTSAEDNTPIPGVNIAVKGTNHGTVTDINGNYKLVADADSKLIYSFIGLQTQEVDAKDQTEISVSMQTDASQLSELIVTGYSPYRTNEEREPVIKLAEPAGGKKAYDKYLKTDLVYPRQALENKIKGRVTISFTVRTNGSLDDFNVVKGLGYGCDEEVIRLVKEGPKWSPTTEDSVPVESEVRVRVKFALPD